ncbi:MAG: GIY-YIG nuclease family protein [Bacteroidales bacterium]
MFYFYILYSDKLDRYYLGSAEDTRKRLVKHNEKHKGFTGGAQDWKLVYTESFRTLSEARQRELQVKRKKSRKYIEWLISRKSRGSEESL